MRYIMSLALIAWSQSLWAETPAGYTLEPADSMRSVLYIKPYPLPEKFDLPDLSGCSKSGNLSACERLLLDALPRAQDHLEARVHIYAGFFADLQSQMAEDPEEKDAHRKRAIDHIQKAVELAEGHGNKNCISQSMVDLEESPLAKSQLYSKFLMLLS